MNILKRYWWIFKKYIINRSVIGTIARKYHYLKKRYWYERNYWSENHNDYFKPNGITYEGRGDILTKADICIGNIHSDGKILDLGCGNGLLLKIIMKKSLYKLTPYGVDFLEKSIIQAKKIFPEYSENFSTKNIIEYQPNAHFNYLIVSLGYERYIDTSEFLKKWISFLTEGGKIIILNPTDTYKKLEVRLPLVEEILSKKIEPTYHHGIYSIIIEKTTLLDHHHT